MNKPTLILRTVLCLVFLACCPAARGDAVDELIAAEMRKRGIPGLSLAVLHQGKVVKLAGYGLANVELKVPVTVDTVFQIQSITKTFTAAGILLLVDEGRLSLEDPVSKHLDGTPESWKPITIRHLLTHTSGIKDFINEPTASLRIDVTEDQVLRDTAPRPLNFEPGQRYAYSNTNYHLLAMIIRKHTGQSYGDFLSQRVFKPMEMTRTRIVSHSAIIPDRASGYHVRGGELRNGDFVAESILGYGGGGIVSTAGDLAKWAAAFESDKLLKKTAIQQAWTPPTLTNGAAAPYALGWAVGSIDGHRIISHSGGHSTGFTSQLAIFPDDALSVIILTNCSNSNAPRLARQVASLYVPALAIAPAKPIEDKEPAVTALLRDCLNRGADWTLDPAKFTPELWEVTSKQRQGIQPMLKALGELKSMDLLARSDSTGLRVYRFRANFANGVLFITMTLNQEGVIAGLFVTENE